MSQNVRLAQKLLTLLWDPMGIEIFAKSKALYIPYNKGELFSIIILL